MTSPIINICTLELGRTKDIQGFIVILKNHECRVYSGKRVVHIDKLTDTVMGIKFGQFGREDGCLALVYKNRGIEIRYL